MLITGTEENSEIIDDAAIHLLRMFIDANVVMVKHLTQIKKMFGAVATDLVNKIYSVSRASRF